MREPKIIFEDEDLLVIDKPSGMVVNRAQTVAAGITVQDWVETKNQKSKIKNQKHQIISKFQDPSLKAFFDRSGIVHRLDKETSGLLLIAKNPESFANLQAQFKNRQVVKKYLALVHGKVAPEEGEIKAPIARLPWNRERFGVFPGGREAVTRYKRLSVFTEYSLLEVIPQTGRTHQIRVHLKYAGHPLVSDLFYAGRKTAREDRKFCPRLFLHASFLRITHPRERVSLEFESPIPSDLKKTLDNLKPL